MKPAGGAAHRGIILVTGVAGAGKTTVGRLLAAQLGWPYFEADDFHPESNRAKMASGIPLDDADRAPWLAAIHGAMVACERRGESAVFTCSALKETYRRLLTADLKTIYLVFLTGDRALLRSRLEGRQGHYMAAGMLESQLAILEPPAQAITLEVDRSPAELVAAIRAACGV